ncbi:MAG: ion channel [Spirochaetota bacterium]|nr:ion channel [Spirochaetota bacterium]
MNWLRQILLFMRREKLHRLAVYIILIITASTLILPLFESDVSLTNALWWSIVTLTTVGYGDIAPATLGGRIIGIFIMFFGIGILGMFTATVASIFIERKQKEERGMNSYKFENHIIICEWNHRASDILLELRKAYRIGNAPIVLIDDIQMKPVDDENLFFIQGDVSDNNLRRANLEKASTVIILGDDKLDASARDARVVLTTLTVESINPNAYTIVELVDIINVPHCERANANEIIVGSDFSSKLISRAAVDHGISKVLSELLTSRMGNDLFKIPVPKSLEGLTFIDVFTEMKRVNNSIVLGIQKGSDGIVKSNPPVDFLVESGDSLILIKEGKPSSQL